MAQRHGTSLSEEPVRSRLRTFRVGETVCNNRQIELPRYHREFRDNCQTHGSSCEKCSYGRLCPLIKHCTAKGKAKISCSYVENKIWEMINQEETLCNYEAYNTVKRWLLQESDIGDKIIKRFSSQFTSKEKKKLLYIFLGLV